MKSLKSALSTEDHRPKGVDKVEPNASLLRGVNKSKSQSLWAFEVEEEDRVTEASLTTDALLKLLNEKLEKAFKKNASSLSEMDFERIVEEFQDEAGGGKTQMAYLLLIEDKLSDIIELAKQNLKRKKRVYIAFLESFSTHLSNKIAKLRRKEKSTELNKFDNIVTSNFKKRPQEKPYFIVEEAKPVRMSKERNRKESQSPRKASTSTDNKLNRLFSKQKRSTKQKDSNKKADEEAGNATATAIYDQSISFSAALATNLTVKTRKRKSSNEKKDKVKKSEETSQKEGDEAFMFFRPKKHRK